VDVNDWRGRGPQNIRARGRAGRRDCGDRLGNIVGCLHGKTSQQLTITLKVSKGKVVKVTYAAKYGSCGEFTGVDKVQIAIKNNKFSATVHPNSETIDKLRGSFKRKKVSGTLSSSLMFGGIHPSTCKSGKLKFSGKL
jgi:hypothetical protein